MTVCEDICCMNLRYDNMLGRDVCDEVHPRPDACPLNAEYSEERESDTGLSGEIGRL